MRDKESFHELEEYYERMEKESLRRKRQTRKPKRAQNAKDQVAKGHGWACGTCAKKDIVSEMTIVAERCYLCKQWRPKELADNAWEFQHLAEGAA